MTDTEKNLSVWIIKESWPKDGIQPRFRVSSKEYGISKRLRRPHKNIILRFFGIESSYFDSREEAEAFAQKYYDDNHEDDLPYYLEEYEQIQPK